MNCQCYLCRQDHHEQCRCEDCLYEEKKNLGEAEYRKWRWDVARGEGFSSPSARDRQLQVEANKRAEQD
jgi:hypothetical protein